MPSLREGALVGIGNALLDLTVHVDEDFLRRHGIGVNESVLGDEEKRSSLLKELAQLDVRRTAGGSGLNVLRAAQWVIKTPNVCTFFGCVGNDENGSILLKSGKEAGVQLACQVVDCPTSTCVVLVTGAFRSMCSFQNASGRFSAQQFMERETQELLERASVVYLSGFFLNVCTMTAYNVAEKASKTGKKLVLDLGAPRVVKGQAATVRGLLPFTDIVFGNDAEFAALGEILGLETARVEDVCLHVARIPTSTCSARSGRTVVMTRGSDSVIVASPDGVSTFPCIPIAPSEIVDVNGAGDAFLGGFLAKYLEEASIAACVGGGLSLGSVVIRHTGCSFS